MTPACKSGVTPSGSRLKTDRIRVVSIESEVKGVGKIVGRFPCMYLVSPEPGGPSLKMEEDAGYHVVTLPLDFKVDIE